MVFADGKPWVEIVNLFLIPKRLFVLLRLFQVNTYFWRREPWNRFWTMLVSSPCPSVVLSQHWVLFSLLLKGAHLSALHLYLIKNCWVFLLLLLEIFFHNWGTWEVKVKWKEKKKKSTSVMFWSFLWKCSFPGISFLVNLFWHGQFWTEGSYFITGSLSNFSTIFTMPSGRCIFHKW